MGNAESSDSSSGLQSAPAPCTQNKVVHITEEPDGTEPDQFQVSRVQSERRVIESDSQRVEVKKLDSFSVSGSENRIQLSSSTAKSRD